MVPIIKEVVGTIFVQFIAIKKHDVEIVSMKIGEKLFSFDDLKGRDSVDLLARTLYAEAENDAASRVGVAYLVLNRKDVIIFQNLSKPSSSFNEYWKLDSSVRALSKFSPMDKTRRGNETIHRAKGRNTKVFLHDISCL